MSSDSDFNRLATKLREAGRLGGRKTPELLIAACAKFVFLEVLKNPVEQATAVTVENVRPPAAQGPLLQFKMCYAASKR